MAPLEYWKAWIQYDHINNVIIRRHWKQALNDVQTFPITYGWRGGIESKLENVFWCGGRHKSFKPWILVTNIWHGFIIIFYVV